MFYKRLEQVNSKKLPHNRMRKKAVHVPGFYRSGEDWTAKSYINSKNKPFAYTRNFHTYRFIKI
jgi:hypothetical protein